MEPVETYQVGLEQGKENCCFIHVVLVPYISGSDEYKSKPAQHSVKELQGMGVSPDIIILRADGSVGSDIRRKISTFCNVKPECVIENLTMPSLYQCPLMLHTGGLDDVVVKQLHLDVPPADLTEWKEMLARIATRSKTCTIALVGKYVKLHDAYLSVMESLYHAGFENDSQVEIKWVEPSVIAYVNSVASSMSTVKNAYAQADTTAQQTILVKASSLLADTQQALDNLKAATDAAESAKDGLLDKPKVFKAEAQECDHREFSFAYPLPAYGIAVFTY